MSDVDVILVVEEAAWGAAWDARGRLSAEAIWSTSRRAESRSVGRHDWIGPELVLVECLIAAPAAVRLADPVVVLAGPRELPGLLPRRPPIERVELDAAGADEEPAALLYEAFARSLRRDGLSAASLARRAAASLLGSTTGSSTGARASADSSPDSPYGA